MAILKVRSGGAWTYLYTPKHRQSAAWQLDIGEIKRRESGIWVTYWPPGAGGGQSTVVSFNGGSIIAFSLTTATAGVTFRDDGTVVQDKNGNTSVLENWAAPTQSGLGSSYEVRATLQSGTTPSGTLGTWLSISTNPTWSLTATSGTAKNCDLLIEVRPNGGAVLDSATYSLNAEANA
jgi:hypothetical protein